MKEDNSSMNISSELPSSQTWPQRVAIERSNQPARYRFRQQVRVWDEFKFNFSTSFILILIATLTQLIIAHSKNNCQAANWNPELLTQRFFSKPTNQQYEVPLTKRSKIDESATITFTYDDDESANLGVSQTTGDKSNRDRLVHKLLLAYPSQRNFDLVRRLTAHQLDYQVFYPKRELDAKKSANSKRDSSSTDEAGDPFSVSTVMAAVGSRHAAAPSWRRSDTSQQATGKKHGKMADKGKANQVLGHYNRTNVVIKAFNYKFRLDLELNNNLFGPSLIQKHFLPKGAQQISTQKVEHCYYHARTQPEARPSAIGAFRTCNGLSGIIHVNNESFVIHPFYDADLSKKHPHIIYRYQTSATQELRPSQLDNLSSNLNPTLNSNNRDQPVAGGEQQSRRECGNTRLHEWALRQYNKMATLTSSSTASRRRLRRQLSDLTNGTRINCSATENHHEDCDNSNSNSSSSGSSSIGSVNNESREAKVVRFGKRDVGFTEKYIELALILSQDIFDKRNSSSRLEVLHDAIQIVNCLDLYFRSVNTRVALIYVETWAYGDQIEMSTDVKQTLYNFLEYSARNLYKVSMDAVHLITGGHTRQFESNEVGMSIPDSICSSRAVSVSQEASIFEPFIAASTIAHMLGHNLGMEHDKPVLNSGEGGGRQHTGVVIDGGGSNSISSSEALESSNQMYIGGSSSVATPTLTSQLQPVAGFRGHNRHNQASHQLDQEEHEDEIKGRSLSDIESSERQAISQAVASNSMVDDASYCQANCLMNERFTYLQPPVSFGNMIQQQIANGLNNSNTSSNNKNDQNQSSTSFVTIFNVSSADLGLDQQQQRQQHTQLNGPTMNQIDSELQNDHLMSTSLPFRFSRQSIETYHRHLRLGQGICLFNKPNQLEDFKTCGNGIVDKGEDCDCGTFQECLESDSCCDPITCRFKADAECINGACCDRCKLRPRGFICRKLRGECDLPEMCDGKSGQCAPDVHKQNGHPCAGATAYCYLGQCPVHDAQCSGLWGSDARKSDRLCYASFNVNGTIRGNCGYDTNSRKYKRCDHEHMMCGTLQCQLGDMKPVTASIDSNPTGTGLSAYEFSKKTLHAHDGNHYECKAITGPASGPQLSSISYVREGTKCGTNKVCFNQTCQTLEQVYRDSFELCPRDEKRRFCSGNGICSTSNRCHCEQDWTGNDCSQHLVSLPATIISQLTGSTKLSQTDLTTENLSKLQTGDSNNSTNSILSEPLNLPAERNIITIPIGQAFTGSPQEIITNTVAADTSTTTTTKPTSPPVLSPSNVVLDKKKHDALGAPTLVFILVSIVAAVYLGFALMANCYRRKGFIRPDKVLRHHQMNCKLDALRSSFIAKRLADAEAAASNGSIPSCGPPMNGGAFNGLDLLSPFVPPLPAQAPCQQHLGAIYSPGCAQDELQLPESYEASNRDSMMKGFMQQSYGQQPQLLPQQQQHQSGRTVGNQKFAASVHYFDEPSECIHQRGTFATAESVGYEADANGDHIPLLMASTIDPTTCNRRPMNQSTLRSFNGLRAQSGCKKGNLVYQDQQSWAPQLNTTRVQQVFRNEKIDQLSKINQMNRATSLGNVNRQQMQQTKQERIDDDDEVAEDDYINDDARRTMTAHRALVTPSHVNHPDRDLVSAMGNYCRTGTNVEDSCSAPSSPDHRDPCWSDAERRRLNIGRADRSLSRHLSASRLSSSRQITDSGYQEDVILGALPLTQQQQHQQRQQQRRSLSYVQTNSSKRSVEQANTVEDDEQEDLPPLPPPPPPLPSASAHLLNSVEVGSEDDSEPTLAGLTHHNRRSNKRQSESDLDRSPIISGWSNVKTVRRIPLNNGESFGSEQLSLITQLQQLERVQSLHQKQVASDKKLNTSEGLHEFFSLPLSVQLSALLARSLRENRDSSTTPIDEYLNTLNNSSVVTSSRRSFKRASQQQSTSALGKEQQEGSRSGTLKGQQMKLHNLQGLINRLQKLHNQTVLQQQLDELNGELDDDMARGSRQSTLGRLSRMRSVSRANQTADDSFTVEQQSNRGDSGWNRGSNTRRAGRSRDNISGNKNESVYSMSDSEDGFVSRMIISYPRKTEPNDDAQEETEPVFSRQETIISNKPNDQQMVDSSGSQSLTDAISCADQSLAGNIKHKPKGEEPEGEERYHN